MLYDSCFNGKLSPNLEMQLVQLYRPALDDGTLMVTAKSVQQQDGAQDCGLFSIAHAYHFCSEDPAQLTVDQQAMRPHLRQNFEAQKLTPFPPANKRGRMSQLKHFAIATYCTCALPASYDTDMIMCDECEQWYHFKCVGVSAEPEYWLCTDCTK